MSKCPFFENENKNLIVHWTGFYSVHMTTSLLKFINTFFQGEENCNRRVRTSNSETTLYIQLFSFFSVKTLAEQVTSIYSLKRMVMVLSS